MTLVLVLSLCVLASGCSAPTAQQKEDAINAALAGAFVACKAALADPKSEWAPGAKSYCEHIVNPQAGCLERDASGKGQGGRASASDLMPQESP